MESQVANESLVTSLLATWREHLEHGHLKHHADAVEGSRYVDKPGTMEVSFMHRLATLALECVAATGSWSLDVAESVFKQVREYRPELRPCPSLFHLIERRWSTFLDPLLAMKLT
jgi:hypothetical protein